MNQATEPLSRKSQKAKVDESAKCSSTQRTPPSPQQSLEVDDLIVHLTGPLENWDNDESANAALATQIQGTSQADINEAPESDPIRILATKIHSTNAVDQDHFACSTQLDVEEPETYARAMQGPNTAQWAMGKGDGTTTGSKIKTWYASC